MKRIIVLVGLGAFAVAAVLTALVLFNRPGPRDKASVSCPIYFSGPLAKLIPGDHVASSWQVYRYDGEKGTANVTVSASPLSTPTRPYSCRLDIDRAPETPGKGSDWRIGHVIKPDGFRGKAVRYRVAIKSEQAIRLDNGQIYAYDGFKVVGASTPLLTQDWRTYEATIQVHPAATTFEVWFRLLLDQGTVKPGKGTVYFVPELDIEGG